MIANDHLNWHGDFDEYARAKQNLFAHQTPEDIAVYYADNEASHAITAVSPAKKIPYFASPGAYIEGGFVKIDNQAICQINELKLLGEHNQQNVCAAITTAWQITHNTEAIRSVVTAFSGLPHRLEFVKDVQGVHFYNDSFASNPDASIAALGAIPGNKVMIVGGFDRMLPLEHLITALQTAQDSLRAVVFMGASASRLVAAAQAAGFAKYVVSESKSIFDVIQLARQYAQPGDNIVLSPGFASFDMFKNFEDRGEQFKQAVEALA